MSSAGSCPGRGVEQSSGFTLLEVLVALAVFSISLLVVMEVFSVNLRNLSIADHQVQAAARATILMRQLVSDRVSEGVSFGQTEEGFQYRVEVVRVFEERYRPIPAELLAITLTVSWSEGMRERSVSLVRYCMQERKI